MFLISSSEKYNNTMVCVAAVAGIAPGLIIVVTFIVGIILMDHPAAILAGCVMPVIAVLAQRGIIISGIVPHPDPLPTPLTADGLCVQTAFAKIGIIKLRQILHRMQCAAYTAGSHFFHLILPPKYKLPRAKGPGLQGDNI